jgi:uncharacterized protein
MSTLLATLVPRLEVSHPPAADRLTTPIPEERTMELTNELRLAVPIEEAWAALTDLERVAPCMPGAQLQEVEGDEYRGIVKVKVGAISAQYTGTARLVERDERAHRAVLQAAGRDTRGQGNATARVTAVLTPADGGTAVSLVTDLSITGKVAQFGRSVLSDVSGKLLGQFARQLETALQSSSASHEAAGGPAAGVNGSAVRPGGTSGSAAASGAAGPASSAVRTVAAPEAAPVNLLEVAGPSVAKRVVPLVAAAALGVLASVWLRRRRTRGSRP